MEFAISMNPGADDIRKWIRNVETEIVGNLTPFWDNFAVPLVAEETARVFVTQGYGAWPKLTPRYARRKARIVPGRTILRLTDRYFRAATQARAAGNFVRTDKDSMVYGVDVSAFPVPYPIFLEVGTSRMPSRPVWGLLAASAALQQRLIMALTGWIGKEVQQEARKIFG